MPEIPLGRFCPFLTIDGIPEKAKVDVIKWPENIVIRDIHCFTGGVLTAQLLPIFGGEDPDYNVWVTVKDVFTNPDRRAVVHINKMHTHINFPDETHVPVLDELTKLKKPVFTGGGPSAIGNGIPISFPQGAAGMPFISGVGAIIPQGSPIGSHQQWPQPQGMSMGKSHITEDLIAQHAQREMIEIRRKMIESITSGAPASAEQLNAEIDKSNAEIEKIKMSAKMHLQQLNHPVLNSPYPNPPARYTEEEMMSLMPPPKDKDGA